ncbi:hypothetical protein [Amnibacterium setariae]|uniref:Uncharacterized protein n=1 Tax=Amnibacterium setariae TaxID=2306585 RepID=A0A3A1TTS4_9MICO|nr:hypothetical protein [Amnibacterium setariae]RIX26481.1 hypothetical protein D1781_16225 [Amnibacterium setariae]
MNPDLLPLIEEAVIPAAADLVEARAAILAVLSSQATATQEFFIRHLLERRELTLGTDRDPPLQVQRAADGTPQVDRDDPVLVRARIGRAVLEALGVLAADGLIMQASGSYYGPGTDSIGVHDVARGMTGGVTFVTTVPAFGGDGWNSPWRLTRPANHPVQEIARLELVDGVEDLLGPRGVTVLREAVRCFQRGLYLAAVDLLAAASEAAWFTLGSKVEGNAALRRSIRSGRDAGEVIAGTVKALRDGAVLGSTVLTELHARAGHLRELRNYGLHPLGAVREEHEDAFTEAGAALLFMGTRSYFLTLHTALEALQAPPAQ